jgi:hypothetical protein
MCVFLKRKCQICAPRTAFSGMTVHRERDALFLQKRFFIGFYKIIQRDVQRTGQPDKELK